MLKTKDGEGSLEKLEFFEILNTFTCNSYKL